MDTDAPSPKSPSEDSMDEGVARVSPSTGPWSAKLLQKAGKLNISEDDPSLRRSCRMKAQKKGFKGKACADKSVFLVILIPQ